MAASKLAEAFTMFARYGHGDDIHAEHDTIWAGPEPDKVTPEDAAWLEANGWIPDEDNTCFMKYV